MNPEISVLTSVYNGEAYLPAMLRSIARQTFNDFEWIIINDGSQDRTLPILQDFARRDPRLLVIDQPNLGIPRSINRGLAAAKGRYIARMDADDICLPQRLELQYRVMEANPGLVILGGAGVTITPQGEPLAFIRSPLSDTAIRTAALIDNPFIQSAVMLRTADLRAHNLAYDPGLIDSEDYDLFSRLLDFGKAANLDQPLVLRRLHPLQKGEVRQRETIQEAERISRRNLASLGFELSIEDVRTLRRWHRVLPQIHTTNDERLAACLFAVFTALARQPQLDPRELSWMRARWLLRFLLASPRGAGTITRPWRARQHLRLADGLLLARYLPYRRRYLKSLQLTPADRRWAQQMVRQVGSEGVEWQ